MIWAGIVGGAGYTAGELLRILHWHPEVSIAAVQSTSHAGAPISQVHKDLAGELDQSFVASISEDVDVLFLCMGHGRSRTFLEQNSFPESVKIIDLSRDYRLTAQAEDFVYGLPELNRDKIAASNHIANPGCFATAIQLALLPLAQNQSLQSEVHVHALTGSTGAGQNPGPTTHFSWRNGNVSVYKAFTHQHLDEINQSVLQCQPTFDKSINFIPVRGTFTRGIFASLYMNSSLDEGSARQLFSDYYTSHPFVHVLSQEPDLKQVVNTNKCFISIQKHQDKLFIISTIDNLIKGASGQAVQNMNLMFGLPETMGLGLKASAF